MKKRLKRYLLILSIAILASSCSLPGLNADVGNEGIVIAGGNTTERQILAEIVYQMAEHYIKDVDISIINNLGSSTLIYQAMMNEEVNVSGAMYTGTSLTGELRMGPETDPVKAYELVVKGYDEKFDQVWFPSYGFSNTYAFMVTKAFSEKENLKTVSDLERLASTLKVGVDTSWMKREGDGYEAFKAIYGFEFGQIYPMEIGLVYNAIATGDMDVVLGYSTGGRIVSNNLTILEDDRRLFPAYDASPVATKAVLEEHPELEKVLLKLEGEINNETMQKMNRRSDEELVEPDNVAKEFLEEHHYFESKEVVPLKER